MKKIFTITVEYPDNDMIPSSEVMEVAQECIGQYMERHFGANIMDGDYDRIKVKEISDKTMIEKARQWFNLHFRQVGTPKEIKHDFESKERMWKSFTQFMEEQIWVEKK